MTSRARARWGALAAAIVLVAAFVWVRSNDGPVERRVRWELTAVPDGALLKLRAVFGGSSCTEFDEWKVDESDTQVDVGASALFESEDCTADEVFEPHSVVLNEPLGDRRLVGCDPTDMDADCTGVVTP